VAFGEVRDLHKFLGLSFTRHLNGFIDYQYSMYENRKPCFKPKKMLKAGSILNPL
jgi:hypothetical protein